MHVQKYSHVFSDVLIIVCFHCLLQDLHRTGCGSYCGQEAEQDRVVLKRVLLAYARWNKTVGYCQGFNVLAALILEVAEGNEGDALKVCLNVFHLCMSVWCETCSNN